jgi:hypothetical protein
MLPIKFSEPILELHDDLQSLSKYVPFSGRSVRKSSISGHSCLAICDQLQIFGAARPVTDQWQPRTVLTDKSIVPAPEPVVHASMGREHPLRA